MSPQPQRGSSRIPFNRAGTLGNEWDYMRQVAQTGHLSGDGPFTARCQVLLEEILGAHRVLLTTSGTHALELAALVLGIGPGDEVILPSYTFPSTAAAFVLRGASPVFCDIRPDTMNLDERLLPGLLTARTRAIVPVHYAGVPCEMGTIAAIADGGEIALVEDNAHGLFGRYDERWLGTLGCMGALSFHESKNFSCGEGGALIISDPDMVPRAEILREKGTNRSAFFRGEVDRYTWVDVGSSYLPSDLLAAFLLAQLEAREDVQQARARIAGVYRELIGPWAAERGVALPQVPPRCESAHHLFHVILPSAHARARALRVFREAGIQAVSHYEPLHLATVGRRFGYRSGDLPVTEDLSRRVLRLPLYTTLTEAEQVLVVDTLREALT